MTRPNLTMELDRKKIDEDIDSWDPMRTAANYCFGIHVARSAANWADPVRHRVAWFAHGLATQVGGFDKVAEMIPLLVPDVIGTPTMRRLAQEGQTEKLGREDALAIFHEMNPGYAIANLGRTLLDESSWVPDGPSDAALPKTFGRARESCIERLEALGPRIRDFCMENGVIVSWDSHNPGRPLAGSHMSLGAILTRLMEAWKDQCMARIAKTAVREEIWSALDFALAAGPGITLIEGDPRSGKTSSTEGYAQARLDRVRYMTMESTMTDSAFYADVNRALGNPKGTAQIQKRLRAYIREVMDTRDLVLVIDEAHWLWGSSRRAVPSKINWIMTALVNRGCSVVLVVTPQFMTDLGRFEKETQWAAEQWKGRILNYVRLPSKIADEEIASVARVLFPEGDAKSIAALAALAKASPSYLGAIKPAVTRARWLAAQAGEPIATKHVIQAVGSQGTLITDLAAASRTKDRRGKPVASRSTPVGGRTSEPSAGAPRSGDSIHQGRLQGHCNVPEQTFQPRLSTPLAVG